MKLVKAIGLKKNQRGLLLLKKNSEKSNEQPWELPGAIIDEEKSSLQKTPLYFLNKGIKKSLPKITFFPHCPPIPYRILKGKFKNGEELEVLFYFIDIVGDVGFSRGDVAHVIFVDNVEKFNLSESTESIVKELKKDGRI